MTSELFPRAGKVERHPYNADYALYWPMHLSERGNTMQSINFFTRSYTDAEPSKVLITRTYESDTEFMRNKVSSERSATLDEMVEFARSAQEQLPDSETVAELNEFVRNKLEDALQRLGSTAVEAERV